jgi:hypothetical protein
MAKQIVNKTVSFNAKDPFQKSLLDYTNRFTNFSAYIKSLIQRDMEGGNVQQKAPFNSDEEIDKTLFNGLI